MRKLSALMLLVGLLVLVANIGTAQAEEHHLQKPAYQIAKMITATRQCHSQLDGRQWYARYPWMQHTEAYYRTELNRWTVRYNNCKAAIKEKKRQWNWQVFPQWVKDLARCESSYNWWAEATSTDGTFYSAFNISRSQYDKDAHYMGVRGWHEGKGVPSPYEQAMAVIGHMRLLGDGFNGSCHGIARSSWS